MKRNGGNRIAVLWDLDGVIIDTAEFHFAAWRRVFEKRGINYTKAIFKKSFGRRNETVIPVVMGKNVSRGEVMAIAREKEGIFRRLSKNKIRPFPGAIDLIRKLSENGVRMALVTSTPARNIKAVLGGLGIIDLFQTVISGEDVKQGKPAPEGYLLAAERLGVSPENCVVIEDSTPGVSAAKNAGMRCIAITNTRPGSRLKRADLVIDSLEEIVVESLERMTRRETRNTNTEIPNKF